MNYIHIMQKVDDLTNLDFRALTLLAHLFETQNVSRTGELLGLSQPATSRALAQLRTLLGDPLVIRSGRSCALTARAERLVPKVAIAISALKNLIEPETFEPARSNRKFRLATTDYGAAVVLPNLLAKLAKAAPTIGLEVVSWNSATIESLSSGRLDFALYADGELPPDFHTRQLFGDSQACLVRRGHPLATLAGKKREITPNDVVKYPQIVMSYPDGWKTGVDEVRGTHGRRSPCIPLQTPYFLLAPLTIIQSDTVICIPLRLANILSALSETEVLKLKGDTVFSYRLIWHERIHNDQGFKWLRQMCLEFTPPAPIAPDQFALRQRPT